MQLRKRRATSGLHRLLAIALLAFVGLMGQAQAVAPQWFHVRRAMLITDVLADREPGAIAPQPISAARKPPALMWVEIELTPDGVQALKVRRNMPIVVVWRKEGRAFRRGMDVGITQNDVRAATNGIYRWRTWIEVPLEQPGLIEAVVQDARKRFVRPFADGAAMFRLELAVLGEQ